MHRRRGGISVKLLVTVVIGVVLPSVLPAPGAAIGAEAAPLGPPPVEGTASSERAGSVGVRPSGESDRSAVLGGIETESTTSEIAAGLHLTEFDRFGPRGWLRGDVLAADLAEPALRTRYLHPGKASERAPLSHQAARTGAVAGVNGDFFDIGATGAPVGVGIADGELLHASSGGHERVAAVGERVGRLMRVFLDAEITRADGSVLPATDLNSPEVAPDGIGVYTSFWGTASRSSAVEGARRVTEIEVSGGAVRAVRGAPAPGPIPTGTVRLLGVGAGAEALASMSVGERVDVRYRPRTRGAVPRVAVGGNKVLLRDGVVQPVDDTTMHPRTAVGFSADGKRMWLVTVDGRQARSRGMTERELAVYLKSLGADDALNLDGGGSSTLVARDPGDSAVGVRNSPSAGRQRPVPNGIGFATAPGSGRLRDFRVEAGTGDDHDDRVLAGLTRGLRAYGHDETGDPVAATPRWAVSPPGAGRIDPTSGGAVFRAERPGPARVTATRGGVAGETGLTVLGPPVRLSTSTERLRLDRRHDRGRFRVIGYDDEGFRARVRPADVQLRYDPRLLRVSPDRDGFVVTALAPSAATVITARVGDLVTRVGVTVGSRPERLSAMDEVRGWRAGVHPQQVRARLSTAAGRSGTPGLALDYSLSGTTATRAAYVNADPSLRLPTGTRKLGGWVNGDGRGGWLRFTVVDENGVATTVDLARHVDWTGWRYVEAPLPAELSGELRLRRLYVVEPDPNRQYRGRLVFDDLTASVSPPVHVPPSPAVEADVVLEDGTCPSAANRVAVVSDAQFTAADPNGRLVRRARRSLRQAVAADPDMIVINGDLVDRGTAADFDLARRVIRQEVGDRVPWIYVPGNHETYGPGDLGEFTAEFGRGHGVVDRGGTRFVTLDSSRGSLRAGGFDQVTMLRRALEGAVGDPSITSVAVFRHHPDEDPTPADASELSDPLEADLVSEWLTEFERASGKTAVSVAAHAGTFHATTVEGVPHLINGNAGKTPSTASGDGGFTGWSLLCLAPTDERRPIRWQPRPYVDELRVDAPEHVTVGSRQRVTAELVQGERTIPVSYPIGADWWGSFGLHVGVPEEADPRDVAAFDPSTGLLTALRPGSAELGVTVNSVTRRVRVAVSRG